MALIDEVREVWGRLADKGWRKLLKKHGLDLPASASAARLEKELLKKRLKVKRNLKGFGDFALDESYGITPGKPALSLLYHALASAAVHPTSDGQPASGSDAYPTLEELDAIENYIYSLARKKLSDFPDPVIAVFAYQYRSGYRSPHGIHADMAFSRAGISRVGTTAMNYEATRRSFWPEPAGGTAGIAVMPARFGTFLAEQRRPIPGKDVVLRGRLREDSALSFLFPVHKLFPGKECLLGENISEMEFLEYHINEKLRRVHTRLSDNPGFLQPFAGFDINQYPFVRDSTIVRDPLVTLKRTGATCLLVPVHHDHLVRTAKQRNMQTGREETVRFVVPPQNKQNRFETSLEIPAGKFGRAAPEYVNIRHKLEVRSTGEEILTDLNILNEAEFAGYMKGGGFEAVHFIDDTCDGAIRVIMKGFKQKLKDFAAYSLVTAPDFLPLVDQLDIQRWADRVLGPSPLHQEGHFSQGGPRPLCDGRFRGDVPNPSLVRPGTKPQQNKKAFNRADPTSVTMTAVVGSAEVSSGASAKPQQNYSTNFLPDAASDIFAPGWDISEHGDKDGRFYAAYGLGSPFPEDAKLCAALNSFWPAAAPDTSRTFGMLDSPTALPMLDNELGYHPMHPRVQAGQASSLLGWDGEFGPFFESLEGKLYINFASIARSDYVSGATKGLIGLSGLVGIDSIEMLARMEALRFCIKTLPPATDIVARTLLWLVTAEKVRDWVSRADKGDPSLYGEGYLYEFATVREDDKPVAGDMTRLRRMVRDRYTCHLTADSLCWNENNGPFNLVTRPPAAPIA